MNDIFKRMHILVTDPVIARFSPTIRAKAGDHQWTFATDWSNERLVRVMKDVDVLVASSATPATLASGNRLKLVHVTGAGFDKIPFSNLPEGVLVANTFHHGRSVAEHVLMVSLMLSRRMLEVDHELRAGTWRTVSTDRDTPFHVELNRSTLGLIGFGNIGQEVARLSKALGMKVHVVRRDPSRALPDDVEVDWIGSIEQLDELVSQVDFLVVTVPLDESTWNLVDRPIFEAMKPTSFLINVARGGVVNEGALFNALREGQIAGAGIDVWWGCPTGSATPPAKFPFTQMRNVVVTPHHSGNSITTYESRATAIGENIRRLATGQPLLNVVQPSGR